jgi:hypothetical protein
MNDGRPQGNRGTLPSKEHLIERLQIARREALEFNRQEALDAAEEGHEEKDIAL